MAGGSLIYFHRWLSHTHTTLLPQRIHHIPHKMSSDLLTPNNTVFPALLISTLEEPHSVVGQRWLLINSGLQAHSSTPGSLRELEGMGGTRKDGAWGRDISANPSIMINNKIRIDTL